MFSELEKKIIFKVKQQISDRFAAFKTKPYYKPELPWNKVYLSGGAIASLLQLETPKDWDFYFDDIDTMFLFEKHLRQCELFIADVNDKYGNYGVNGKMITANAITMDDGNSFITKVSGTPSQVKASFDYVHCTPHFIDGKLYISEKQFDAIVNKKLIVNNSHAVKEYRHQKFLSRGYTDATIRDKVLLAAYRTSTT